MIRIIPSLALQRLAASGINPPVPDRPMRVLVWGFGLTAVSRREAVEQARAFASVHSTMRAFTPNSDAVLDVMADALADVIADEMAIEYLKATGELA